MESRNEYGENITSVNGQSNYRPEIEQQSNGNRKKEATVDAEIK